MRGQKKWNLPIIDATYKQITLNNLSLDDYGLKESNEIIFIGNSITYRSEWSELFRNPKIKNRGINSDIISGVLLRIDEILESKPKKIFILIGINDLSANFQIQLCVDNYQKIISKIRTGSPLTSIYI